MASKRKSLTKKLNDLLRKYIRIRDRDTCQKCGKLVFGSDSHPSHVKPKSRGLVYRWAVCNVKLMCMSCHQFWHLNPMETQWFEEKFPGRWDEIEAIDKSKKFGIADLEGVKKELEDRIWELSR